MNKKRMNFGKGTHMLNENSLNVLLFLFSVFSTCSKRTTLDKKPFENIVKKGENTGNQHLILFPQCFQPYQRQKIIILSTLILSSANAFSLDQSKILSFGKEFKILSSSIVNKSNRLLNFFPNKKF